MTKYVPISKCHLHARAKQRETNVLVTKYVLISKCHLQARAKQLETHVLMSKFVLISKCHLQARGGRRGGGGGDHPTPSKTELAIFSILIPCCISDSGNSQKPA